ncbi:MAG: hypothetical protein ABW060_16365 [Solirubrobacteraceae bacterium]|jgi:hypothetical protein
MSATARSARPAHRRTVDRTIAPRTARRVSGPVTRRPVAVPGGAVVGRQTAFARVRALPDSRWLDRALRGRLWIWLLGVALLGVVGMQVSLLKLNSGIGRAVETSVTLERQNAALEASIARLSDTNRVQVGAAGLGMLVPAPGDVGYLDSRPSDPARAVEHMTPPSADAAALLANGGIVPGSLAEAPAVEPISPAPTTTTTPAVATPTPDPTVAAEPAADPAAVTPAATDAAVPVE